MEGIWDYFLKAHKNSRDINTVADIFDLRYITILLKARNDTAIAYKKLLQTKSCSMIRQFKTSYLRFSVIQNE